MAFTHYRTKGIVLAKDNRGEADQALTVFTQDFGKIEILGRAIRKITSKLRSGIDLFYLSEIEFIQGKNYKTLTDAVLIDKFKNIQEFPEKFEIAQKMTDALNSLTGQEEQDEKIWNLLINHLSIINNKSSVINNQLSMINNQLSMISNQLSVINDRLSFYYFLWNLFSILGYGPELYHCTLCSKKLLPETFFFSPDQGGIVCWRCIKDLNDDQKKSAKEISVDTAKIIRIMLAKDWLSIKRLKIDKIDNLIYVSDIYLEYLKENL